MLAIVCEKCDRRRELFFLSSASLAKFDIFGHISIQYERLYRKQLTTKQLTGELLSEQ